MAAWQSAVAKVAADLVQLLHVQAADEDEAHAETLARLGTLRARFRGRVALTNLGSLLAGDRTCAAALHETTARKIDEAKGGWKHLVRRRGLASIAMTIEEAKAWRQQHKTCIADIVRHRDGERWRVDKIERQAEFQGQLEGLVGSMIQQVQGVAEKGEVDGERRGEYVETFLINFYSEKVEYGQIMAYLDCLRSARP
ncbi:hypothetical protein PV10_09067 [Exophiala mesophila]|uniref:Uncharacterized protein n=1 Tax=Exophiala mesophila TaxID=212818 RepID=A0A0D1Z2J8_EXOME|nr:uncharacterized protein PV10_09067 [Exophiala mesophila]KIV88144.1 hypothetical protein PV10_09067 [Exophiala mesophila]